MASSAPTAPRGQRDPVHDQVRQAGQQQPVLRAGWLALGSVGHDRLRPGWAATERIFRPAGSLRRPGR